MPEPCGGEAGELKSGENTENSVLNVTDKNSVYREERASGRGRTARRRGAKPGLAGGKLLHCSNPVR